MIPTGRNHLAPHRPSAEKEEKFSSFSGHNATSQQLGEIFGVSEKTVRNAAEFAEVVIPSVPPPLAPHRPSTENGVKLTPLSGSHATARQLGATTVACVARLRMPAQTRALHRPPAENADNLSLFSGDNAAARNSHTDAYQKATLRTICPQGRGLMRPRGN
jgi:hypothetical protein